jgi:hypothetical protein
MTDYSCLQTFEGHSATILNAVFINKGMQIMSSAADGLIRMWSIRTGVCEATFDKHNDRVWALATIPKDRFCRGMPKLTIESSSDDICDQILISGGSDSSLHFWLDTTIQEENKRIAGEEEKFLMEQTMLNDIRNKRYGRALRSALELNHASKVAMILSTILEEEDEKSYVTSASSASTGPSKFTLLTSMTSGSASSRSLSVSGDDDEAYDIDYGTPIFERLDSFIYKLSVIEDKTLLSRLIGFTKDWNTNSRQCHIAQAVINSLLRIVKVKKLITFDHAKETAKALLSYNERHYQRLDKLYQASFLLEYMTSMMALYPLENKTKNNDDALVSKMFESTTTSLDDAEDDSFVPNIFSAINNRQTSSRSNFDSDYDDDDEITDIKHKKGSASSAKDKSKALSASKEKSKPVAAAKEVVVKAANEKPNSSGSKRVIESIDNSNDRSIAAATPDSSKKKKKAKA